MRIPLVLALMLAVTGAFSGALARAPTPEEQARIEAALRTAGYTVWSGMEIRGEGDRIVVQGARKVEGGPSFDVVVEPTTLRVAEEVPN